MASTKRKKKGSTAYEVAICKIFAKYYTSGANEVRFTKADIDSLIGDPDVVAANFGKKLSNPPALVYEFRSRRPLPREIAATAEKDYDWTIELDGKSKYVFRQARGQYIEPRTDMAAVPIPDATPEIITKYRFDDEQALLAKIRYNRLIDIFLGIVTYSLQNHLRTSVKFGSHRSQIEIDELYVGVDKSGRHYVIPVQAKGGTDKLSKVQAKQDILWCREQRPNLECRAIAAQFVGAEIVLFLAGEDAGEVKVIEEKRYKLVPADQTPPKVST